MIAGLRYTDVRYYTSASDNYDQNGVALGVPDSQQRFGDWTYNTSVNVQVHRTVGIFVVVSRGFRAPNVNDLGTIGARTLGYDVPAEEAAAVNAIVGADSGDGAAGLDKKFSSLGAERLLNYELGVRVSTGKFHARVHAFDAELMDPISGRTLLFPAGQAPQSIAGVRVFPLAQSAAQRQQGLVAVATDYSPRAVHSPVNDGRTRYMGIEGLAKWTVSSRWRVEWNYTLLSGRDLMPVRPVRRLPPQEGGMRIWYVPAGRRPWLLVNARAAGAQTRLNGGDIDDERIGASFRRSDIASFFTATVNDRYLSPGPDGRKGTADDVFTITGETLLQIQNRVLPIGSTINGVTVTSDGTRVPMYLKTTGWWTLDIHSGVPVTERLGLQFGVSNLLDRNYRVHGSGVDALGINAWVGARYVF